MMYPCLWITKGMGSSRCCPLCGQGAATHRTGSTKSRGSQGMPERSSRAGVPSPPAQRTTRSAGKKTLRSPIRATHADGPSVTDHDPADPAARDELGAPAHRLLEEPAAVPLGPVRAAEHAPAAAPAALVVDHLRGGARLQAQALARLEEPTGGRRPRPLVCRAGRDFSCKLLELAVQPDADLPQGLVRADRVARRQCRGAARAFAVHDHHPAAGLSHAHAGERQADHPLVEQQPPAAQPLHPCRGKGEPLEVSARFQDGHLVCPLQLPRNGRAAGPASHHDRPRGPAAPASRMGHSFEAGRAAVCAFGDALSEPQLPSVRQACHEPPVEGRDQPAHLRGVGPRETAPPDRHLPVRGAPKIDAETPVDQPCRCHRLLQLSARPAGAGTSPPGRRQPCAGGGPARPGHPRAAAPPRPGSG